jgi:hypothetical protein
MAPLPFHFDRFVDNPGLIHLVIYRDCRDVTSSFLKQARTTWRDAPWVSKVDTAEKIAQRWVRGIDIMEQYAAKVYITRYETLMQQPRRNWIGWPTGWPSTRPVLTAG